MIRVCFRYDHSVLSTLEVQGHAGHAGVCMSVSLLLQSALKVLVELQQRGLRVEVKAPQEGDFCCYILAYPEQLQAELRLWSRFLLSALQILTHEHAEQIQLIEQQKTL